jgi:hypothetical protein
MPTMSKEKKKTDKPKGFTYRPEQEVLDALWEYHDGLEFEVPYASIIDKAVRLFLREKGFTSVSEKPASDE